MAGSASSAARRAVRIDAQRADRAGVYATVTGTAYTARPAVISSSTVVRPSGRRDGITMCAGYACDARHPRSPATTQPQSATSPMTRWRSSGSLRPTRYGAAGAGSRRAWMPHEHRSPGAPCPWPQRATSSRRGSQTSSRSVERSRSSEPCRETRQTRHPRIGPTQSGARRETTPRPPPVPAAPGRTLSPARPRRRVGRDPRGARPRAGAAARRSPSDSSVRPRPRARARTSVPSAAGSGRSTRTPAPRRVSRSDRGRCRASPDRAASPCAAR